MPFGCCFFCSRPFCKLLIIVVISFFSMDQQTYLPSKPMLHSNLARAMYDRLQFEQCHRLSTHDSWYSLNPDDISSTVADRFLRLYQDDQTTQFLENCFEKADRIFTELFHSLLKFFVGFFVTRTTINGWLGRGSMFLFSTEQFGCLLGLNESQQRLESLLDIGAGDGKITSQMAPLFRRTYVTELSPTMQERLQQSGFTVLDALSWSATERQYDVIACLNVLDRCDRPASMLREFRARLAPSGLLVVSLVLPFNPYVEMQIDHQPTEALAVRGDTFEQQVASVVEHVFAPAGFQLVRFTRLPYLCEGDLRQAFYWLDAAIFVLR